MRIYLFILSLFVITIPLVFASEDKSNTANIENLKILRKSVNFAYKMGNDFLDLIRGSSIPFESAKSVMELGSKDNIRLNDFVPIYKPFIGYIILIAVGLVFVVIMPIVGFCFCLCRCVGKCGGKVKGMDPKHATCKRYIYAVLLGMISVVMLAGIVLAFINNQLIHDALTNPSDEINAKLQISLSCKTMRESMKNITEEIKDAEKNSKISADQIEKANFKTVISNNFFSYLEKESINVKFKEGLAKISKQLSVVVELLKTVKKPNVNLEKFNQKLNNKMRLLQVSQMQPSVNEFLKTFGNDFQDLKKVMKEQSQQTSTTGTLLRNIVHKYNTTILDFVDLRLYDFDTIFKVEYLEYRMYICIGVCCLLLLIVLFYFLGLCFGQCGERPFEDARICNRGVGANLMMAGVAFAFLFTPTIMVITMILFVTGGSSQTETCRYLTNSYEPGVKAIDSLISLIAKDVNLNRDTSLQPFTYNEDLVSIINRCPSMPMAMAFNLNTDFMTPSIAKKISDIVMKVKTMSRETLVEAYLSDIRTTLSEITKEIQNSDIYENFDSETNKKIKEQHLLLSSEITDLSLNSYDKKINLFFESVDSNGFNAALTNAVKSTFNQVYVGSYNNVRCVGMHNSMKIFIDAVCVTFLWPFNGFWYGVGICLVFTIPAIIFAVKLAGLYRHTEKYSADYEEPDYHSYMGFYTNNADNIPMKKPKSGKNNQKNRNSNYNNKDSLKQTNPQYLPVYPYDAYE